MESISKTKIGTAEASRIVDDAFGGGVRLAGMVEMTDGWFNAAYRLALSDGRSVVLKIAPPPHVEVLTYETDILRAEVAALRVVRERTTAPVPEVLWVDEASAHLPSRSFLMAFVAGESLRHEADRITPEARAALDRVIGRHLREIHQIVGPSFGLFSPSMPRHERWVDAFGEIFRAVLSDGRRRDVALPIGYDDAEAVVVACTGALDQVTVPRLVLWDLWDGNVMIDPDTFTLTGLLDLERAMWGDPLLEAQFGRPVTAAFTEGYGCEVLATAGERCRRELYSLYLLLVMSIEGAYRQYPSDPLGEWARGRLAATVARCHELAVTAG